MKRLSGELVELKQHLEHYDKIQELTQMLQESHRCLRRTLAPEQQALPAAASWVGGVCRLVACTWPLVWILIYLQQKKRGSSSLLELCRKQW